MRKLKDIGILPKREKMGLLCDADNRPLDFDGLGIVGFGRYCMSLPGSMMSKATLARWQGLRPGCNRLC
jgi:hypothetical protein